MGMKMMMDIAAAKNIWTMFDTILVIELHIKTKHWEQRTSKAIITRLNEQIVKDTTDYIYSSYNDN